MAEPLSPEEEAALRAEFEAAYEGGWRFAATNKEVARLLATLDAARAAVPAETRCLEPVNSPFAASAR